MSRAGWVLAVAHRRGGCRLLLVRQWPSTTPETAGGAAHTWSDYRTAGGQGGAGIAGGQTVSVACRLQGFKVEDGNVWWYRLEGSPWSGRYYATADAFYNDGRTSGSLHDTPYFDPKVPVCS